MCVNGLSIEKDLISLKLLFFRNQLQLEGKKRWRLYDPRGETEVLPRFSSPNFEQSDLGPCILDTVLEPGDLLYFPRGVIHQAVTQVRQFVRALLDAFSPVSTEGSVRRFVFRCGQASL